MVKSENQKNTYIPKLTIFCFLQTNKILSSFPYFYTLPWYYSGTIFCIRLSSSYTRYYWSICKYMHISSKWIYYIATTIRFFQQLSFLNIFRFLLLLKRVVKWTMLPKMLKMCKKIKSLLCNMKNYIIWLYNDFWSSVPAWHNISNLY